MYVHILYIQYIVADLKDSHVTLHNPIVLYYIIQKLRW